MSADFSNTVFSSAFRRAETVPRLGRRPSARIIAGENPAARSLSTKVFRSVFCRSAHMAATRATSSVVALSARPIRAVVFTPASAFPGSNDMAPAAESGSARWKYKTAFPASERTSERRSNAVFMDGYFWERERGSHDLVGVPEKSNALPWSPVIANGLDFRRSATKSATASRFISGSI